jgi:YegS/Rv2252/BmrU family lipid kinase
MAKKIYDKRLDIQAIINPISGIGSKCKIPRMIENMAMEKGYTFRAAFTEGPGHAAELAKKAIQDGAGYIYAVGGDGTVNEIAAAMLHSEVVLAIIPKGSGNGLARELHIPLDTQRAIDMTKQFHIIDIDACKANGRIFFSTCGFGFDAAVSKKFAGEKRRGTATYVKNTVTEYLNYKPEIYELYLEDYSFKETAFLVVCANASQYGNNAYIAPHANIRDGKMDITILTPFTPMDIPPLAYQLFTKQIGKNSKIRQIKASQVTIVRQENGLMHLDGEPIMSEKKVDISVIPSALKVFTPTDVKVEAEPRAIFGQFMDFFDKKHFGVRGVSSKT